MKPEQDLTHILSRLDDIDQRLKDIELVTNTLEHWVKALERRIDLQE
jgi:hypothetical protein